MNIFPLFASNVFVTNIEENLQNLQKVKEYEYIETKEQVCGKNLITKNKNILQDFPRVKSIIKYHFDSVKNNILNYKNTDFEITTSWATKFYKNSCCQFHSHMNCFYSGILYFDEYDEHSAMLEFESPFVTQQINVVPSEYNITNARVYSFKPQKNILLFFPSHLRHRVTKHFSEFERYSLAFNLMPVGKLGEGDSYIDFSLNF